MAAGPAAANGWAGFYAGSQETREEPRAPQAEPARQPAPERSLAIPDTGAPDEGICIRAILEAQERHGIPDNILLGLGLQEAGLMKNGELTVWPWAVNSEGKGHLFDSADEALAFVSSEQARGARSIDVGCMQINLRWHPDAFVTDAQGFWPGRNADYAARFLRGLYEESGDWMIAVGHYHSRTPEHQGRYTASAKRNIAVANQRIANFEALAGLGATAPVRSASAEAPSRATANASASARQEGAPFWSTRSSEGPRRTLFGTGILQPILPSFTR